MKKILITLLICTISLKINCNAPIDSLKNEILLLKKLIAQKDSIVNVKIKDSLIDAQEKQIEFLTGNYTYLGIIVTVILAIISLAYYLFIYRPANKALKENKENKEAMDKLIKIYDEKVQNFEGIVDAKFEPMMLKFSEKRMNNSIENYFSGNELIRGQSEYHISVNERYPFNSEQIYKIYEIAVNPMCNSISSIKLARILQLYKPELLEDYFNRMANKQWEIPEFPEIFYRYYYHDHQKIKDYIKHNLLDREAELGVKSPKTDRYFYFLRNSLKNNDLIYDYMLNDVKLFSDIKDPNDLVRIESFCLKPDNNFIQTQMYLTSSLKQHISFIRHPPP